METIEKICTDCGGFFHIERKRGRPAVRCLSCREKKQTVTQFALVERKTETVDGITMVENAEPCRDCGQTFMRQKKRGKPPVRCAYCKEVADAAHTAAVTVSQEDIEDSFKGDPALLKGTPDQLPRGGEAQCPGSRGCGRIFTSNSACDDHKTFGTDGNLKECKDPATFGMIPIERRGLPIWRKPMDPDSLARFK